MHLFYGIVFKHSRDITILIALLWFSIVHFVSVVFYWSAIIPTLVENSLYWFVSFLWYWLTDEPTHSISYGNNGSASLNYIWEWSICYGSLSVMFIPLHSKNCSKSMPAIKVATMKNTMVLRAPVIYLTNTAPSSSGKIEADFISWATPTFWSLLLWIPIVVHDK